MALVKGTAEYKQAQKLANEITTVASYTRGNHNTLFNIYIKDLYVFVGKIKTLGVFASKVAETIYEQCNPFGYQVARISDKQAWILACAAVENGITL